MSPVVEKIAHSALFKFALWLALTIAGARLVSWLDTRYAEAGQEMHFTFSVLLLGGGQPFVLSRYKELSETQAKYPDATLILPEGKGEFTGPGEFDRISYTAKNDGQGGQEIEVIESDDDLTAWSSYRVEGDRVIPVKSRVFAPGHTFFAAFWAFVIVALYGPALRFIQRRR
ncbi:MAG: hypothetical protein LBE62_00330 [Azonexus sp.]|jgi:hypothetical protein|nr:hypothetical protein [Azonexus sp.]